MPQIHVQYTYTAHCEKTIEVDDEEFERYVAKDLQEALIADILRDGEQGEYDDIDAEFACDGPEVSVWKVLDDLPDEG